MYNSRFNLPILLSIFVFTSFKAPSKETKIPGGNFKDKLAYIEHTENFNTESERLHALLEVYYDYSLASSPINATYFGEDKYNAIWGDFSPEGFKNEHENFKLFYATTSWFDASKLGEKDALNYSIYSSTIKSTYNAGVKFPQQYLIIDQIQGIHSALAAVIEMMPTRNKTDFENILSRLKGIPDLLAQVQQTLNEGIKKGYVMPTNTVIKVPEQISILRTENPEESSFYLPFKQSNSEVDGFENLQKQAAKIIAEEVNPSLENFKTYFKEEYLPKTRSTFGISAMPDGAAWYNAFIQYHTTTNLTAKEIHEIGLSEVARISKEMDAILKELNFQGDKNAFNQFLRDDPQFYFDTPDELLTAYRDICKRIDPVLPQLFGKLPRLTYGVKPVPTYAEKSTTTAYYQPGSTKSGLAGYFFANTYDLKSRPKWEMEALSIHEAVPGHHLQIALAQEMEEVPKFRTTLMFTAFVEGWGLYSESLGPELGMYTNPYSKYGQLTYEMWRAIRLVVDTGIHAFGWSRDEAIQYFSEHSGKAMHDIEVEIDRYIAWPGQALAYKIGELKIKELKKKAQNELKDHFDIRAFHDVVLGSGAVPLDVLEQNVNKWISEGLYCMQNGRYKYSFNASMWQYQAQGGWFFVSVPKSISEEIRSLFQSQEEGWGRLKATAQIGHAKWKTAIWFDTKMQLYLLPVKAEIRKKEKLVTDAPLAISIWI